MLKLDRFSCSQKIWLKRDPPVPSDLSPAMHAHNICAAYIIILYSSTFGIKLHGRTFSLQTWGSCPVEKWKPMSKCKYFLFLRASKNCVLLLILQNRVRELLPSLPKLRADCTQSLGEMHQSNQERLASHKLKHQPNKIFNWQ